MAAVAVYGRRFGVEFDATRPVSDRRPLRGVRAEASGHSVAIFSLICMCPSADEKATSHLFYRIIVCLKITCVGSERIWSSCGSSTTRLQAARRVSSSTRHRRLPLCNQPHDQVSKRPSGGVQFAFFSASARVAACSASADSRHASAIALLERRAARHHQRRDFGAAAAAAAIDGAASQ